MRISLKVGATVYPLAGQAGVSERTHSSAGEFRIAADSQRELIQRVRAATAKMVDRGNLATTITFSTSRQFATPAEAFLYTLDHDGALPRAGTLVMETAKPSGAAYSRYLMDVVISPPARRVIGCTALLDYTATGGGIIVGPSADVATGSITVTGTTNFEWWISGQGAVWPEDVIPQSASVVAAGIAATINDGSWPVTTSASGNVVTLTAKVAGAAGNSITLYDFGSGLTRSGPTLTGGVG